MNVRLIDRLGGDRWVPPQEGAVILGRFLVEPVAPSSLFLNSIPVQDPCYLVPDLRGQWQLLAAGDHRCQGSVPRSQLLDDLDLRSIVAIGKNVQGVIEDGGTWLDVLSVSPLVPGMSEKAGLQSFELLLEDQIGHLKEVCLRPRTHLRVDVERAPVSRARRLATQAAGYLASHTEDWDRPTVRAVIPKRVLALVREDQFDIYENRVAVRLVDHLDAYLAYRVREVAKLVRLFGEAEDYSSAAMLGSHWRQKRVYSLWGESLDASKARQMAEDTLKKLRSLKYTVAGLMDSTLYREVSRKATVGTTLKMTNILANDQHYQRVAELWLAWARLGLKQIPRPAEHFQAMQDLCKGFNFFSLLVAIRALDQIGMEPQDLEGALASGALSLEGKGGRAELSWSCNEGWLRLRVPGARPLRLTPLVASLETLDARDAQELIKEADNAASGSEQLVLLYPALGGQRVVGGSSRQVHERLHALSHEVASPGAEHAGFLPISPWDLSSVERMARALRWIVTGTHFLSYPQFVADSPLRGSDGKVPWLEESGTGVVVRRLPHPKEELKLPKRIAEAEAGLAALRRQHADVSDRLRVAVSDRAGSGQLNAKKKELNAAITKADRDVTELKAFAAGLEQGVNLVRSLLTCPTCGDVADDRRDFRSGQGKRFACVCSSCSTSWGTELCPTCKAWLPTLMPAVKDLAALASHPAWVDRYLGADVLAVPSLAADGEHGYVCHECGHGRTDVREGGLENSTKGPP